MVLQHLLMVQPWSDGPTASTDGPTVIRWSHSMCWWSSWAFSLFILTGGSLFFPCAQVEMFTLTGGSFFFPCPQVYLDWWLSLLPLSTGSDAHSKKWPMTCSQCINRLAGQLRLHHQHFAQTDLQFNFDKVKRKPWRYLSEVVKAELCQVTAVH